jgi:phosphopantetheine adenylyltransferase
MSADRTNPSALLLLPPPPAFSIAKVKEAFAPSLSDILTRLSQCVHGSSRLAVLDIALVIFFTPECRPRAKVFSQLQQYLTSVYSIVGALCATQNIELDTPGGIDVRVIFINHSIGEPITEEASDTPQFGPIIGLQSLANSTRHWDHIYYVSDTVSENMAKCFVEAQKDDMTARMQAITCTPDWTIPQPLLIPNDQPYTSNPHSSVIVGGTFDHLHLGHKLLLTAFALALDPLDQDGHLIIGLTGDALLVNKKHAEFLEDWEQRWKNTASFLSAIMDFSPDQKSPEIERATAPKTVLVRYPKLTFEFVEISDPFGPTITVENIDVLVVSRETRAGGAAVNDERVKKGWKALTVFEVDVLQSDGALGTDENFESKISSTEVRRRRAHLAKV